MTITETDYHVVLKRDELSIIQEALIKALGNTSFSDTQKESIRTMTLTIDKALHK